MTIQRVEKLLRGFGRTQRDVTALYLFGSQVTGRTNPLSDLDVAVLLEEPSGAVRRDLARRLTLTADILHTCQRSDVDVVILNEAPPALAHDVVSGGQLIYERDHQARVSFEARTIQHYLDVAPFLLATSSGYLKRQLLDGTYGG